jgi:EAL domain-containing protein (putative c-di-GMP-specific phosphodiesterase class I)
MKEYVCLFKDESSFKQFITDNKIDTNARFLVMLYSSGLSPDESVGIASFVKSLLPYSEIAGTSSFKVSLGGEIYQNEMMVRIVYLEKSRFEIKFIPHTGISAADLSLDIVGNLCDQTTKLLVLSISGGYPNLTGFVDEFNKLVPNIRLAGGPATSVKSFFWGYVFDDKMSYMRHFMVTAFSGSELNVYSYVINNVEPVGDIYEITAVNDGVVEEIAGIKTLEFLNDTLGVDVTANSETLGLLDRFPLMLVDRNNAPRQLVYNEEDHTFSSPKGFALKYGERFRCCYMSSKIAYHHYCSMIDELNLFPSQVLWAFSCFLRPQLYVTMHYQTVRFFKDQNLSFSYVGGEFASDGICNEVYTGSFVYLSLSEDANAPVNHIDKSKLKPFLADDLDTRDIFDYVLSRQSEEILSAKESLLKKIAEQEKKATESLFIDKNTQMYNVEKFSYDCVKYNYHKLTLVVIEKSIQLSNYFGSTEYVEYYRHNVKLFEDYLRKERFISDSVENSLVNLYSNDLSSFIIAASDRLSTGDYMELVRTLFLKFNCHYTHNGTVCMNNFFIVVDQQEELLEKAKLLYSDKKNELKRFVVYEDSHEATENFEESLAALAVVNYAIEHDGIEPYFQPIYDNICGRTYKFESLMRIKDANGRLWFPNQFLPVAKEFRLYLQLSCAMINKVFELFDGREESVSINLSAIDINSEMVTSMIYKRLATLRNPSHFIFEILESDAFEDLNLLSDFITKLRTYNVMIAIDDFGAGYSNLLEIVKLKPDLIKIDGEIIKHLLHDEVNRNIMDVIIFLAKKFSVDLVAEYAESKELQEFLESKGIRYSQGYYFSKPLPYSQIDAYLESERRSREERQKPLN